MKKKFKNIPKKYQIITLIFVGITLIISALLMNSFSLPDSVDTVSFQSKSLNYENKEAGSFEVTKSTKWISKGKARVDINIDTISKIENEEKDIILVLDTSFADNLVPMRKILLDFVDKILSNENSKIALVTYDQISSVRNEFTNNEQLLFNRINTLTSGSGKRNYYQALVSIESILKEYEHENDKEVAAIFVTSGYSKAGRENEKSYYEYLKKQYPFLIINTVWYGINTDVVEFMKNSSDYQYITSIDKLNDTLSDITNYTKEYDSLILSDLINDTYFDINSISNVKSSTGIVRAEEDNLTWSFEEFHTGRSGNLSFDISLKEKPSDEIKMISITKQDIVTYKLEDIEEIVTNEEKIKLPTNYQIIYEENKPGNCELTNFPSNEIRQVKEIVELSNEVKCGGYVFQGWTITTEGIERISNNQFIMPNSNVIVRAEWSTLKIEKSMDGTIQPGLPPAPVINTEKTGYPVITEYGVFIDSEVSIDFLDREDIDNYYSIDDGKTWKIYQGPFNRLSSTTVRAKSCLKDIDDCIESSKVVEIPSDALPPITYDKDYSSGETLNNSKETRAYYLIVEETMYDNEFLINLDIPWYSTISVYGCDESDTETLIGSYNHNSSQARLQFDYFIEPGTRKIKVVLISPTGVSNGGISIFEVEPKTNPKISGTQYYPTITGYGVDVGYSMVTIKYFQTVTQRLYRINGGEWQEYQDKPIRLEIDDTIEAKGADIYGYETPTSSYTSELPNDALPLLTYDGDHATGQTLNNSKETRTYYLAVDETMYNNEFSIDFAIPWYSTISVYGYDENDTEKLIFSHYHNNSYARVNWEFLIESGTKKMKIVLSSPPGVSNGGVSIFEIESNTRPTITEIKHYPRMTKYGVVGVHNEVTIDYVAIAVTKLYRINGGEWQEYQDKPIWLNNEDVIEARSIDKYGSESTIASHTAIIYDDAILSNAYDQDESTYLEVSGTAYVFVQVDEEMQNQNFEFIGYAPGQASITFNFLDSAGEVIETKTYAGIEDKHKEQILIPEKAVKIGVYFYYSRLYEIRPTDTLLINRIKYYPKITESRIEAGYNEITINYPNDVEQRLYRINQEEWNVYQDKEIRLEIGETIEVKGINSSNKETKIVSYKAELPSDALGPTAYDKNYSTSVIGLSGGLVERWTTYYIDVSEEMWNKEINVKWKGAQTQVSYMHFLNSTGTVLQSQVVTLNGLQKDYTIPENTTRIWFQLYRYLETPCGSVSEIEIVEKPVIKETKYYPKLTENGVEVGYNTVTIDYSVLSKQKLYRINQGKWTEYQDEEIRLEIGDTIEVKGINKEKKETEIVKYRAELPNDALGPKAYDGDFSTEEEATGKGKLDQWTNYYIDVSEEMWNKEISVNWNGSQTQPSYMNFNNSSGNMISFVTTTETQANYIIPENTTKILIPLHSTANNSWATISEIQPSNRIIIAATKYYPKITENGVETGYNTLTISYPETSTQKFYRINKGKWIEYQDQEIRLEIEDTIEAKGINSEGKETEIVKYRATLPQTALGQEAYDGNYSTRVDAIGGEVREIWTWYYIDVSEEMWNKEINVKWKGSKYQPSYMHFVNSSGVTINYLSVTIDGTQENYTIPEGTTKLLFALHRYMDFEWGNVIEIQLPDKLRINSTQYFPKLTPSGIEDGYNTVTIDYPETSIQKLYRIDNGEWQEYQDKEIRLKLGEKIEAKGIDSSNQETEVMNYTATPAYQYLEKEAYDGDFSTAIEAKGGDGNDQWTYYYLDVSEEMWNREINVTWKGSTTQPSYVNLLNSSGTVLATYSTTVNESQENYKILENTTRLWFLLNRNLDNEWGSVSEIQLPDNISINSTKYFPKITSSGIEDGYNIVTINYPNSSVQKLYRINSEEWQEYYQEIRLEINDTIEVKGINSSNQETGVMKYKATLPHQALEKRAYDGNYSTIVNAIKGNGIGRWSYYYIDVSSDMWNKEISIKWKGSTAQPTYMHFFNDTALISSVTVTSECQESYIIPENTTKIVYQLFSTADNNLASITEISIHRPERIQTPNPIIHIDNIGFSKEKTINISYPDGYINEYSLDFGETWTTYNEFIIVVEPTTVLARSLDSNGNVVSSSSFKIIKIGDEISNTKLE